MPRMPWWPDLHQTRPEADLPEREARNRMMQTLHGQGFMLRPFRHADVPQFVAAVRESRASVGVWMPWAHEGYDALDAQAQFDICADNRPPGPATTSACIRPMAASSMAVSPSAMSTAPTTWAISATGSAPAASAGPGLARGGDDGLLRLPPPAPDAAGDRGGRAQRGQPRRGGDRRAVRMHRAQPHGHARAAMRGCGLFAGAGIVRPASLGGVKGSCLRGAVRFEIDRLDGPIVHCPCRTCQRRMRRPSLLSVLWSGRPARAEPPRGPARRHAGAQKVVRRPP